MFRVKHTTILCLWPGQTHGSEAAIKTWHLLDRLDRTNMSKAQIAQTTTAGFINTRNYLTFFSDKVMNLLDILERDPPRLMKEIEKERKRK